MIYVANQSVVADLKHDNSGNVSFKIGDEGFYTQNQPHIDQGGQPTEVFYTQALYSNDEEGLPKYVGRLRYTIELSEEEQAEQADESNMCDWRKFDVYM